MEIEFNNKILETAPFLSLSLELSLREEGGDRIYVFRKMLILSRVSLSVYLPPSLQPLSSIHIYIKVIRHLYMYIYIYMYTNGKLLFKERLCLLQNRHRRSRIGDRSLLKAARVTPGQDYL